MASLVDSSTKKKYLVTGANCGIGNALVKQLLQPPHSVLVFLAAKHFEDARDAVDEIIAEVRTICTLVAPLLAGHSAWLFSFL